MSPMFTRALKWGEGCRRVRTGQMTSCERLDWTQPVVAALRMEGGCEPRNAGGL